MSDDICVPKPIEFDSLVVDVTCHPFRDVVAAGDIDGDIEVYVW